MSASVRLTLVVDYWKGSKAHCVPCASASTVLASNLRLCLKAKSRDLPDGFIVTRPPCARCGRSDIGVWSCHGGYVVADFTCEKGLETGLPAAKPIPLRL